MNAPENSFGVEIAGQSIIVALLDLFARSVLLWTFRRSGLYRHSPRDIRQIECKSKEISSDHVHLNILAITDIVGENGIPVNVVMGNVLPISNPIAAIVCARSVGDRFPFMASA